MRRSLWLHVFAGALLLGALQGFADCFERYPPGVDRFSASSVNTKFSTVGCEDPNALSLTLNGPFDVRRGTAQRPGDGRCEIATEMIAMNLTSGPTRVQLQDPPTRSLGLIKQDQPGVDFPATSTFDIFIKVTGVPGFEADTLINLQAARMQFQLTSIPPNAAGPYIPPQGLDCVTLYRQSDPSTPVAYFSHAQHVPGPSCVCHDTPPADARTVDDGVIICVDCAVARNVK